MALHITVEMIKKFSKKLNVTTDEILISDKDQIKKSPLSLRFTRRIKELEDLPEAKKKALLQALEISTDRILGFEEQKRSNGKCES